jgi:hypothetical protein
MFSKKIKDRKRQHDDVNHRRSTDVYIGIDYEHKAFALATGRSVVIVSVQASRTIAKNNSSSNSMIFEWEAVQCRSLSQT